LHQPDNWRVQETGEKENSHPRVAYHHQNMRRVAWFITGLFCIATSFGAFQQVFGQGKGAQPLISKLRMQYEAKIGKEVGKTFYGQELYRQCDLYRRILHYRVSKDLGIAGPVEFEEQTYKWPTSTQKTQDVSRDMGFQCETSVAINRRDPRFIVAGANDDAMVILGMPAYTSTDGGLSWKTYRLPSLPSSLSGCFQFGDPMIASDNQGWFYYAFLALNGEEEDSKIVSDIVVARSQDGKLWQMCSPVVGKTAPDSCLEDKETIAIDRDPASPYYGRIYLAWMHFTFQENSTNEVRLVYSDNQGKSWSKPIAVSTNVEQFSQLQIGKGGVVVLSTSREDDSYHILRVSTDGGNSFIDKPITQFQDYPMGLMQRQTIKGEAGFRVYPYTAFDIDKTDNTIKLVYGTWDASYPNAKLYAITSTDLGDSWSDPKLVAQPGTETLDRFEPSVAIDETTGEATITMYSSENDPDNVLAGLYQLSFEKAGIAPALRLSPSDFDPNGILQQGVMPFIGDYIGSDAYKGNFVAVWTQNLQNGSDGEVFAYTKISDSLNAPASSVLSKLTSTALTVGDLTNNPVTNGVSSVQVGLTKPGKIQIRVFDELGKLVRSFNPVQQQSAGTYEIPLDLSPLTTGRYVLAVDNGVDLVRRTFVVVK